MSIARALAVCLLTLLLIAAYFWSVNEIIMQRLENANMITIAPNTQGWWV